MRRRAFSVRLGILVALVAAAAVAVITLIGGHPGLVPWAFRYEHDWRGALVARTADADGLRIHSSHSDRLLVFQPHRGEVYFETHDAAATREFLDLVRIDDRASGGHCFCVGGTEVDVLCGSSIVTSFLVKHGQELRSGLLWPGDARLTADSADAVCTWLVAHGVHAESPRQAAARVAAETQARDAAQDALLGSERARSLRACPDDAAVAALLTQWEPDAVERVVLAVRFLALEPAGRPLGDEGAGHLAFESVKRWLGAADDAVAVATAFDRLLAEESVALGAARQFSDHVDEGRAEQTVPGLRVRSAQRLLASPDEWDRLRGVEMLGRAGDTPELRALLLGMLPPVAGGARPAVRPSDAQMEAASLVLRFCDPSMFPRLQELADAATDSPRWGDPDHWAKLMAHRIAARRDPADADPLDETLDVLTRSPMQGVVRAADGTVVTGASVRLTEPSRTPTVGESFRYAIATDTDERGRYRLDVPIGRTWHLSVVHADHPYLLRRDVDLRVPPPTLDLALPKERTIRGRVLDESGRPLAVALVHASRLSPFETNDDQRGVTSAQDGAFEFGGFDADAPEISVSLHFHPPGQDDDSNALGERDLVIRPGDPPVELRLGAPR